ncbi:MAG TPA: hypothetical protein VGR48_01560 [Terriglobales bacterium]|nr:hypothetical protein [Terriglobales bacterium]
MKHPGELVPQTGLYRVSHEGHRATHEAILWEGETFPACRICGNAAEFDFVEPASEADEFEHVGYDGDFLDSVLGGWEKDYSRLTA